MTMPSARPSRAAAVVNKDGVRDHRRRREAIVALDHGLDVVGRQHLECRALRRPRERVRVLAHVERTVVTVWLMPVLADRLGDRQDVRLVERATQGCSAVPAGPEADLLGRISRIRPALEIVPFQPRRDRPVSPLGPACRPVVKAPFRLRLVRIRSAGRKAVAAHSMCSPPQPTRALFQRNTPYPTGHGFAFQISAAYCAMVRSLENLPEPATLRMALRAQASRSAIECARCLVGLQIGPQIGQVHVVVAVRQQRVPQRGEDARLVAAEVHREKIRSRARAGFGLVLVVPVRVVPAAAVGDLLARSGRTGRNSPRRPPPPSRWWRRRACRWSARRSS